jgi:hypothetical protein
VEFIGKCYLNVKSSVIPSSLGFNLQGTPTGFDAPTITATAQDSRKADGDGWYDILLAFETGNKDNGIHRFTAGDSVTYKITGVTSVGDFNYFSTPNQTGGTCFRMAADIQGIPIPGSSATTRVWVAPAAPEPSTLVLLGTGVIGLLAWRRRQRAA